MLPRSMGLILSYIRRADVTHGVVQKGHRVEGVLPASCLLKQLGYPCLTFLLLIHRLHGQPKFSQDASMI